MPSSDSPLTGIVTEKLVDAGEIVAPRAPLLLVADLDTPWANVFIDERDVPRFKLGQPATVFTDAGGRGPAGHADLHFVARRSSRRATCRPPTSAPSWCIARR